MTLDEAIKKCEEAAQDRDKLRKSYDDASGYSRSHNESIRTNDAKECEKCSQDFRQIAEWLKELKAYKEQEPCVDAISRKAVLAMADYIGETPTLENPYAKPEEVVRVKDIMKLPSVTPAQRWIPVSERLPEKSMRCLVTVGRFNFTEIATYSDLMGIINHKIFYQGEVGHDSFEDITQYVKAWMPLPERYTEKEGKN